MDAFQLDARIGRDSTLIKRLGLCQLRLQDDSRWPWLVMVPERAGMSEIFELSSEDRALLNAEVAKVGAALKQVTGATKINIAAIGNIVRQLHVHVIARFEGDPNWPGPVWGFGQAVPYADAAEKTMFNDKLIEALS
ncbi:HIT family protein [Rhizobium sp. NTR19]|uniref:HIT family protein n=1 Tax=Neorhizobium turbinariae TaxID=2937795 RepID=A0ABT0IVW7_9HYPH|nr:HIT family protein [Neorhizobium turbinariae]MCK8782016.1 HIT family protein [Neorhizobium turbinariae]